jgi:hypothetical protein
VALIEEEPEVPLREVLRREEEREVPRREEEREVPRRDRT